MSNQVLPALAGLKYPAKRKPIWSGKVQTAVSGKETRLSYWSYPRYQWTIGYEFLRSSAGYTDLQQLIGFYNARQGQFDDWLWSDPDDGAVVAQQIGVGDGSTTTFAITRTLGGFVEPVRVSELYGAPVFSINGTPQPSAVYAAPASILFASAPAAGAIVTWTGTFYWRVRFDDLDLTLDKIMGGLWSSGDVTFTSVK